MAYRIGIDARKISDFGIGTYIEHLIYALAEIDQENHYLLLVGPHHDRSLDLLPDNFELVVETAPVYSARELVALSWRLMRCKLDLYHATHYVLPAWVPCRAVVTIHDIIHLLYPEYLPGPLAFFYAQRMIRRALTRGDRIIAVSQNTKSDLMDYFEADGEKIRVIYNGVGEHFRERLADSERRQLLAPLDIDGPYLLFVGNPKPHKNLDNVVKAFARALQLESFPGKLVCVGDRNNRDFKLRQRAEHYGISEHLHLVGHVDVNTLRALYQGARLFVYPTLYEGFGLPVIEAMASGVPVITSNNSALKEIAEGYAQLVDPLDVEEMARAIASCMTDEEQRSALAELGRRRADDFRWQTAAEQTLDTYMRALGNGRAA